MVKMQKVPFLPFKWSQNGLFIFVQVFSVFVRNCSKFQFLTGFVKFLYTLFGKIFLKREEF